MGAWSRRGDGKPRPQPAGAERWITSPRSVAASSRMPARFATRSSSAARMGRGCTCRPTKGGQWIPARWWCTGAGRPAVDVGSRRARSRREVADWTCGDPTPAGLSPDHDHGGTAASRAQLGPMLPFGGLAATRAMCWAQAVWASLGWSASVLRARQHRASKPPAAPPTSTAPQRPSRAQAEPAPPQNRAPSHRPAAARLRRGDGKPAQSQPASPA